MASAELEAAAVCSAETLEAAVLRQSAHWGLLRQTSPHTGLATLQQDRGATENRESHWEHSTGVDTIPQPTYAHPKFSTNARWVTYTFQIYDDEPQTKFGSRNLGYLEACRETE